MDKVHTLEDKLTQQQIKALGENEENITESVKLIIITSLEDYFKHRKLNSNETERKTKRKTKRKKRLIQINQKGKLEKEIKKNI